MLDDTKSDERAFAHVLAALDQGLLSKADGVQEYAAICLERAQTLRCAKPLAHDRCPLSDSPGGLGWRPWLIA